VSIMSSPISRLLAAVPLFVASCDSLSITHIAPQVSLSDAQLTRGRRLYLTTCVRCHAPEPVAKYTQAEWAGIMPEMIEDSKLSAADAAAVTRYVQAFALSNHL
jgi:mono/diheme cytochrome c family protein